MSDILLLMARQSNHVNSICSTWGREHFKTFDGDVYQFPGTCEYNLASDCHSESYQEFSVHLKRNEATETEGNPTVKHVVVTINDLVFHLTKTQVAVNGEIVTLPYYNGGVQLERNAVYTKLYSKVGLVVMWNGEDAVMVELDTEYTNRTCGLCGDFNGLPVHSEFIHDGRKVSPIEFGNRQKVHRPNEDCEDPYEEEEEDEPADVQPKEDTCKEFHAQCDQLLRSALWSSCGAVVNPEPYIQACVQDLCGCSNTSDSFCVCSTLAEYSRQCSHAGGQPPHWRTTAFCDKQCPFNMVYLESGSPCMDTCTHSDTSSLCEEHLMDGCFCPHGTVFDDISKRGCVTQDQCQCKHDKIYNSGEVFRQDREECVCHHGQWSCKSLPSPGTCAVEEGSHVTTFDGKAFTFHGDCYYPLAKDEASPKFTVLVQLVPCIRQKFDTCLKSVVVLLNNDRNNALVITADGKVSHNAQITLPYNTADISVFKPSSFHMILQTSFGLQVQIQLVPIMQVYVTLDESYKTKTQGLCGNFNKVLSDDMKTPQGMVEGTASSFGNSWKANPTCRDREERLDDPCSLSVENENYAKHWCSMLRSSDSTFAKCHAMVDPELYYKRCTYASCNCEKSEDCLCAVFSSYVRDCATKGVVLSGWRENVCDKYTGNCPASQTYSDQLQRCQLTCSSLASKRQGCTNDFLPVDGCSCPDGLYMDDRGTCVPMDKCPCFHNGVHIKPGKSINIQEEHCTCKSGKWECTDKKCPGTCTIYGSGHYKTFDERTYGFQGKCGYVAVQNKCGNRPVQDNFMVITENIPCGTTGTTCSKSVRVQLGRTELKLSKGTYEMVNLGVGSQIQYRVRTVGLYLIVESDIGIAVLWDRKTTVRIVLEPQHSGAVCGLCGNYNGDGRDDFTTQGQLVVSSPVDFANSWKVSSTCPDAESNVDPCGARPNRHNWAKMQCSIITGKTFQLCHKKVDPTLYFENCVKDSCACDTGGDCECFCTAVAAYAQACTEAGVCVAWRTPEICRCYPQCPPDRPIFDEETGECVEECQNETFWLCNCTLARCIENNTIEIIAYKCPEPEPITCTNGKKPVLQWDEFYCCQHYVCDCVCEGWGDPHYITFDGLFYSFQGNCTYVLMEEMWPRHQFKIYIDNVNCDPTEDVSCPRAIIVSYRSTVITLKNHNLIGAAQLEALIDGVSLRLPFTRHGVKVMNSGINMVLEIAHLQVVVTFGVTGFSVNLPWQHFGNNTQGHCGTCSNNQADDCMLPGGQLVENCAVMADYWQAKDISQPDCHVPPGIPTNSPLPEPTQKPCKPDSSVCDLLKDSIFAACHPFVSPDNFYKGCVYDSCHVSNPAVECTSLQTYAAACAQFGVCIYWRNHTELCASDCPADKVYKPCGPAEQPTCDDNPDESRMNFTTEGCFCPDGMKLFNKESGICVDKCGCLDPEGVPREFNERFEYKCQDCVCLESTKAVTCKPKVCSKPPVEICTGPGFVYVNQTDPSDPCCSSLVCRCDSSTCPPTNMNCPIGFVPVVSVPEGKCCPEHTCEPKRVCLHKGVEYLPNSKVPGSECQECTCTNKVDPKSGHYQIDCGFMQCDKDCEKGYEYQEPDYSSDDCCGKCVQTHCVLQINGTKQLLKHGDTWSAPGDKCQQYSCVKNGDNYLTQSSNIHCPPFQQANCQPGSIQTAANGCCRICVEKDKACKRGSMKSFINHKNCQSIEEVEMPYCEGSCNTFTKYSAMAASLDHSCACCQESRSSNRTVDLQCLNGDVVPYTYLHVEECNCRHSDCHRAIRVPVRKTRSNTLV
ncbi:mucin-2-like [Salvelinus namaycush]|uniref:Mucin-2-like n=1 Tax=Salvelinus namaycush TaxID=8040 RepID=A0A8U0R3J9_SALNM|nr:mucin-2-like [Salvelinus namaycush]